MISLFFFPSISPLSPHGDSPSQRVRYQACVGKRFFNWSPPPPTSSSFLPLVSFFFRSGRVADRSPARSYSPLVPFFFLHQNFPAEIPDAPSSFLQHARKGKSQGPPELSIRDKRCDPAIRGRLPPPFRCLFFDSPLTMEAASKVTAFVQRICFVLPLSSFPPSSPTSPPQRNVSTNNRTEIAGQSLFFPGRVVPKLSSSGSDLPFLSPNKASPRDRHKSSSRTGNCGPGKYTRQ